MLPSPDNFFERHFRLLVASLLVILAAAQVGSIVQESQTWDEAVHLAAGYSYLKTGDYRLNPEHPPLGKIINAFPLLFLDLKLDTGSEYWAEPNQIMFGGLFLYRNRLPADTLLLIARSMTILLTLILGLVMAVWTKRRFGAASALLALALFCFDPNIIAHGRYVTTDMVATLFVFLTVIAWLGFLKTGRWRDALLSGVVLGLALASKFSTMFLIPLLVAVVFTLVRFAARVPYQLDRDVRGAAQTSAGVEKVSTRHAGVRTPRNVAHGTVRRVFLILWSRLKWVPLSLIAAGLTVAALYGPANAIGWQHPYLVGINDVATHDREGHEAYLLGQFSQHGWWYYFPVAFAVKSPVGLLLLIPALWWAIRSMFQFEYLVLVMPLIMYLLAAMLSDINLGIRHLLPIYPFLFILIGVGVARAPLTRWRAGLAAIALALTMVESALVYPDYLAFFNVAAGGPGNGPRYLLDSNIDWGQDVKKLGAYMRKNQIPKVCAAYFGTASFEYYGVLADDLPRTHEVEKRAAVDCVAAVSATRLYGLYSGRDSYQWLREKEPMAKVGHSIYLYDLRKKK